MRRTLPNQLNNNSVDQNIGQGLVKIGEASKILGVSIDTLRRWEKTGKIRVVRTPGGTRFYSLDSLKTLQTPSAQPQAGQPKVSDQTQQTISELLNKNQPITTVEGLQQAQSLIAQEWQKSAELNQIHKDKITASDSKPDINVIFPNNKFEAISNKIYAKIYVKIYAILLIIITFTVLTTSGVFLSYLNFPTQTKGFFSTDGSTKTKNNFPKQALTSALSPFNELSKLTIKSFLPQKAESLGLTNSKQNLAQVSDSNVLAASTIADNGNFLEINTDTLITNNFAVEGESVFTGNITAPNIIYDLVAGDNITITDSQTPTISVVLPQLVSQLSGDFVSETQGGTGQTTYTKGDILYASDTDTLSKLAIGNSGQVLKVTSGLPAWGTDANTGSDGDITAVNVGNGLSGGGSSGDVTINLDVTTTSITSTTSANSGLETSSSGLSLLRGCSNGQVLGWNSGTLVWECTTTTSGFTSFTLAGSSGTPQPITDGNTLTVAAGNGVTTTAGATDTVTVGLDVTVSGAVGGETSAASGLAVNSDGLGLLRGCGNGQILKWNNITNVWACGTDAGSSGTGIATVSENNNPVTTNTAVLDFNGNDFVVTDELLDNTQALVAIDYPNSAITRSNVNETISGNWTFSSSTFTLSNATPRIIIGNGNTLNITDGTNNLLSIADAGSSGNLSSINNLTAGGTITFSALSTAGVVINNASGVLSTEAQLATSRGGLGGNVTPAGAGELVYSVSSSAYDNLAAGSSGQILTSGGAAAPSWTNLGSIIIAGTGITTSGTTSVTINSTLGTSVDLTSEVTGVLPIANGGTNGTATPTAGGVAYGTGTAYDFTTVGSSGQCLTSNGVAAPSWANCTSSALTPFTTSGGIIDKTDVGDRLRLLYGDAADVQLTIENTSSATIPTADAAQIDLTGGTTGIVTDGVDGLFISTEFGNGTTNTNAALHLDVNPVNSPSGDEFFIGIDIDALSSTFSSTDTAIRVGTNWDTVLDSANLDITNAGAITGATGITSSGTITLSGTTITLSGLTASRALFLDGSNNITTTATSSVLANSISDETGSGALVFGTNPTISGPTFSGTITTALTASRFVTSNASSQLATSGASADLLATLTDETGTGVAVFGTSPSLTTPTIAGSTLTGTHDLQGTLSDSTGNVTIGDSVDVTGSGTFTLGATDKVLVDGSTTTNTGTAGILDINLSTNASQTGIDIAATSVADSGTDTISGLRITSTVSTDTDNIYGVQITNLSGTPTAGNEYGIYQAGTGWDYGIFAEDDIFIAAQSDLRFGDADNSNYVGFESPATVSSSITWALPSTNGSTGQCLKRTGGGSDLTWSDCLGGGGGGVLTVGSMTASVVFADTAADDQWLGLGASAGRIEFDDQTTDEVNILGANVGIGNSTPTARLNITPSTAAALTIDQFSTTNGETGELRFMEGGGSSTQYTGFKAPNALSSNAVYTLPNHDTTPPGADYVLTWQSGNVLEWKSTAGVGAGGDITAVGDILTGPAFTNLTGGTSNGNELYFEGSTADGNDILLTAADPGADQTITIPALTGTVALIQPTSGGVATAQTASSSTGSLLHINETGASTPNLLELEVGGVDTFVISNSGATTITTSAGTDLVNLLTGSLKIGNGTPTQTLNGEDGYVEGTFEVDGLLYAGSGTEALTVASGKIDADAIGLTSATNGLSGTSSASGLASYSDTLSLLQGCTDGQILKWVESTDTWDCSADTGATSAIVAIEEDDVGVGTNVGTLDFRTDFDIAESPSGEDNISIDYTNFGTRLTTFNIADTTGTLTLDIGGVTSDSSHTINIATNGTSADTLAIGNSNASTTLALTGGDDWSLTDTGILTLSASASQTTAIVATDTDYTNFASIGDNNIIGTTPAIDFTNFDVSTAGVITLQGGQTADITTQSNNNLTLTAGGTGDINQTLDADTQSLFNSTVASDVSLNTVDINLTDTASASTGTLNMFAVRNLNESGSTGTPDSLVYLTNLDANETVTNGIFIEQATLGGTLSRGINITQSAGTLTDALFITGTVSNILNTDSIDISGGGAITGATGIVSSGTIRFSGLTTNGPVYTSGGNGTLNSEAQLATTRGGLGADVTAAGGGEILYSTASTTYDSLASGTSGQLLTSGGTGAPSWTNIASSLTAGAGITITGTTNATIASTLGTSVDLTSEVTGVLPIANGGTNKALTLAAGAVVWTDADSFEVTAVGSSGQCLQSNGTSAPSWGGCVGSGLTPFTSSGGIIDKTTVGDRLRLLYGDAADVQLTIENTTNSTIPSADAAQIDLSGGTTGIVTDGVDVLYLAAEFGNGTTNTNSGIRINIDPVNTPSGDETFYGINIEGLAAGTAATETAINIGSNWDNILNTATLDISGAGNITGAGTISSGAITSTGASSFGSITLTTDLAVADGGTGASTFTTNGVLYGNGASAIQATAAGTSGQLLVANGSGVPTFVSMSSDATLAASGALTISADAVALGTDTTGNYVATITGGAGLTGSGASEGSTPTLAVGAGDGITVNTDDIAVDSTTSGTTATTSSNSGIETTTTGIRLLGGCTAGAGNAELLKWNGTNWICSIDSGSGSGASKWTDSGAITYLTDTGDNLAVGGTNSSAPFFIDIANGGDLVLTSTTATDTESNLKVTAANLTTGKVSEFIGTNTATTNTAITQNLFNITNAQSTNANSSFVGLGVNFTNNPSVAGNTEFAARIQNQLTSNATDSAVAALLLLDNADTSGTGSTVVTDGIRITNSGGITGGITNGITIGSGTQSITNGIVLGSTGITTDLTLQNGATIDNDTSGRLTFNATNYRFNNLNCSGNANGGALTANATGDISCTDDDNGAAAITLQVAYDNDVNGGDTTVALTANDDSLIFRNPATGGTDSTFITQIDNLETGNTDADFKNLYVTGAGTFNTTAGSLTNYGSYITNTSTESAGANVLTNVGLYATASGADNNYAAIFESGNVGFGDTTPDFLVDVETLASQSVVIDAASNDNTTTSGVFDLNVDSVTSNNIGFNLDYILRDSAGVTAYASRINNTIDNDAGQNSTNYGLYINSDNDDASSTIYGLFVDADADGGGTGTAYAAAFTDGNVGIGDTSPAALLTVGSGDVFQVSSAGNVTAVDVTGNGNLVVLGNSTLGDSASDAITVTGEILGASPLHFEGPTNNNTYTTFAFDDPTSARTITFPDATGTVCISGSTCASSGTVGYWSRTGTTLSPSNSGDAVTVTGTLTANGTVALGDGGDAITISGSTVSTSTTGAGNDIAFTSADDFIVNLLDNNADALDIQQGTNNYINVNTTDASENISLGNATTNPTITLLGTGTFTIGSTTISAASTTLTATSLATVTTAGTIALAPSSGAYTVNLGGSSGTTLGTTSNGALTLAPNGTGDINQTLDADTQSLFNSTIASDVTLNTVDINLTNSAAASTGTLNLLAVRNLNETGSATGTPDSLIYVTTLDANETVTNGVLVDMGTTGATLTNGINVTQSAGTLTNALNLSGTFTKYVNSTNFNVTNAGVLSLGSSASSTGQLSFFNSSNSNTTTFQPSTSQSQATITYTLPVDDGTATQYLTTDGSGGLSWTSITGAAPTLQDVYNNDVDGGDATILLSAADDSLVFRNPASSGSNTGSPLLTLDQLATGSGPIALTINQAGTTAALNFSGDTGNDITTSGSETLAIAPGGTGAVTLISTTTASALNIASGGASGFALRVNDDGTFTDSTPFVIDNSGNVGVGVTTIGAKMEVSGNLRVSDSASALRYVQISNSEASTDFPRTLVQGGSSSANNDWMLKLAHAYSSSLTNIRTGIQISNNNDPSFTNAETLALRTPDGGGEPFHIINSVTGGNSDGKPIKLQTSNSTVYSTPNLYLDTVANGDRLGIRDTSPDAVLDVDPSAVTNGTIFQIGSPNTATTVAGSSTALTAQNIDLATNFTTADDDTTGINITLDTASDTDATQDDLLGLVVSGGTLTASGGSSNPLWTGVQVTLPATTNTDSSATGITLRGFNAITPALTQTQAETITMSGHEISAAGALVQNTAAGTINWRGSNINMPNITQTTGTIAADGVRIVNGTITTGGSENLINLAAAGVGAGTLNGLNIGTITGGSGTERAINIGTGWDTDINITDTSPVIALGGDTAFTDGTNTLLTIDDQGTYAFLRLSDKGSSGDPATCTAGDIYFNDTDDAFKGCVTANTWSAFSSGTATTLQNAYDNDANGSDTTITLSANDDSLVFTNPSSSGTDSAFVLQANQSNTTGAVKVLDLVQSSNNANGVNLTADSIDGETALAITANALTTGKGISMSSTGTGLTSGSLLSISSGTTGAVATNGIVSLTATGAYTSTSNVGLLNVVANSTATGTVENISANALTTGVGLNISSTSNVSTTGSALKLTGGGTAVTAAFSGNFASIAYNPSLATSQGTIIDTGTALSITRDVTSASGSTYSSRSAVASIESNCTSNSGTCATNASHAVLLLTESYSSAAGDGVLSISNASGSTNAINISGAGSRSIDSNGGNLTISTTTSGTLALSSVAAFSISSNHFLVTTAGITTVNLNTTATTNGMCQSGTNIDTATNADRILVPCSGAPADIAEWYETTGGIQEGELVTTSADQFTYQETQSNPETGEILPNKITRTISKLEKSTSMYQKNIIGIVSTSPFQVFGTDIKDQGSAPKPIALNGRVPTKVSIENGPIQKGDFLTSSSTPGVAMKATRAGQVVGQALSDYNGEGIGKVMTLINIGYSDPNNLLANLSLDTDGSLIVPKIKVGSLTIDGNLITNLQSQNGQLVSSMTDVGQKVQNLQTTVETLADTLNNIQTQQASDSAQLAEVSTKTDVLGQQIASSSAQLADLSSKEASNSSTLAQLRASIDNLFNQNASSSAQIAESLTPVEGMIATGSANLADLKVDNKTSTLVLEAQDATISGTLKSFGETSLGNTTIAGELTVDGTFSITEGSTINAFPTLHFQNSPFAENADFFNGLVSIDKYGKVLAQEIQTPKLTISTPTTSDQDPTIGTAKILAGQLELPVLSNQTTETSKIFITPRSKTGGQALVVTGIVNGSGFVVGLDHAIAEDVTFDWWIVSTN